MLQTRYKSQAETLYIASLKDAHEIIMGKLASTEGQDQIKRLKVIKALIEKEITGLYDGLKPSLAEDMQGFAEIQNKTIFNYMNENSGIAYSFAALPKDTMKEILDFDSLIPMGDKAYTINEFFKTETDAQINRYKQIISGGLAANDGYKAIEKRLQEADATGTMKLSSIVHTSISAARDRANVKIYENFDDVITGWESVATLDSRVSDICAAADGIKYMKPKFKYETIPNRPPRHPNCRSVLRPLTRFTTNGKRPQNGDEKGQVDADVKFPEWFARQSASFQRKWLGDARYQLFKDGKFTIKSFVDVKDGKRFTLKELEEML